MALIFYPHADDIQKGNLGDKIDILMEAAERFKQVILDESSKQEPVETNGKKRATPRDQNFSYNWEEIARILREVRELPELSKNDKALKAELLTKLAEVYEVLRGAKMSKLEAVRLALISEVTQLRSGSSQVA